MQRRYRFKGPGRLWAAVTACIVGLMPHFSEADSSFEPGLLHVAINLGQSVAPSVGVSFGDDGLLSGANSSFHEQSVSRGPRLPDSLHFAGLAGTLNLALDTSNGKPLVEGIELAPREILRIVADDSGGIRGLYGRISIRLDF